MAADSIQIQAAPEKAGVPAEGVVSQDNNVTRVSINSDPKPAPVADTQAIPEKFRNTDGKIDADKLLAAYGELEKKLGTSEAQKKGDAPAIVETPKGVTQDDMTKMSEEFRASGKLSDATYQSLEAKGISRQTADDYIAGQTARAAQYTSSLAEHVGGKEALDAIIGWAGDNLTDAEIKTANDALSSGNAAQAKLTLDGLKARHTAAVGVNPNLVTGSEGVKAAGVQPFASNVEIANAISDKRYKTDPAYRESVYARLNVTK